MQQPAGRRHLRDRIAGGALLTIGLAAALSALGCGNQYRPVVNAIGPVGPAGLPTKYAVAVSNPNSTSLGLLTIVDFAGDTTLSTPQILSNPNYFVLNTAGTQGYAINPQGSLNTFLLSNPTSLISSDIVQTTLPVSSNPISITSLTPASALSTVFIPVNDPNTGPNVDAINAGTAALYATVGVAPNPVYVVGAAGTPRVYSLSGGANPGISTGEADSLETISTIAFSNSAQIRVGINPVYGVMTNDDQRAFVMNEGSNTVSVINVPNNALDANISTINVGQRPVWADLNSVTSELVVLNQGDGVHPGSVSIVNIALCNAAAQATNPNCNSTNPVDGVGFGQVLATVPVGINPSMVSVLQGNDGNAPAAYVINQQDGTGTCGAGEGSVTAINLQTNQVAATICGVSGSAATAAANGANNVIFGHPNSVSATGGLPSGKVYITASDNTYMSVLYTDTNTVLTHIPLQGTGLRVLVTNP